MNVDRRMHFLSTGVIGPLAAVFAWFVAGCSTPGAQRYQSYFQAVELARTQGREQSLEAFKTACSQSSSAACHRIGGRVIPASRLPILQGATEETGTEVVLLLPERIEAQVFLWDMEKDSLIDAVTSASIPLPDGQGRIVQQRYEGLARFARYQLQVVGAAGELLDGRELQTFDSSKKRVVFAVAACMDDGHPLRKQMWQELLAHEPEAIFLIGDNVYADRSNQQPIEVNEAVLWRRYAETRRELELFRSPRLTPILAVWDDHDYGKQDGDRTFGLKATAKKVFHAFFGSAEFPGVVDRGPGVATRWSAFGQRFFFLDDRTYRSPVGEKNSQTHFGADQEAWIFTELFGEVPSWIISGDQFFGGYHKFESFEGRHPDSFRRFLYRLKSQSSPVIFLSGDRHLAELMQIEPDTLGYRTFELTSSSIHAKVHPDAWKTTPNPRQIEGVSGVNNFLIIDSEVAGGLNVGVRAYGPDGRRLFSRSLEVRR